MVSTPPTTGKTTGGTLDWKAVSTWQNLFAAVIAAHDLKINYSETARYMSTYGPKATYDSVEGRFRQIRKEVDALKNGERGPIPEATPRGARDPDKGATSNKTAGGRVTKTPAAGKGSKAKGKAGAAKKSKVQAKLEEAAEKATIKEEPVEEDDDVVMSGALVDSVPESPATEDSTSFGLDGSYDAPPSAYNKAGDKPRSFY